MGNVEDIEEQKNRKGTRYAFVIKHWNYSTQFAKKFYMLAGVKSRFPFGPQG